MWDIKYRPLRFADVLGQDGTVQVLKARLAKGTGLDTSYVFSGGHGQGKTTLARILARALLCQNLQDSEPCNECDNCRDILEESTAAFIEQDAASRGTIEYIRAIIDDLPFTLPGVPKRIYLFDEAHRMGTGAQDVLLKPVEDKKLVAIFCTTEPDKIRGTIRSRCEEYSIRRITREDIFRRMVWVLEQEGAAFEEDAVFTVIDFSHGHVRDILNRLEMVAQAGKVTVEAVRDYLRLSVVTAYYDTLLNLGDPKTAVALVEDACDRVGPADVATGLAEAAMNSFRLANNMHADFSLVDRERAQKVYEMYGTKTVLVADYFLRTYRPTKIGLICDIVRFAEQGATGRPVEAPTAPPVVVSAPPSTGGPSAPEAPPAPPEQAPTPAASPPPPTSAAAPVAAASPAPASVPSEKMRSDGVGARGTGDIRALTDLDHKAVPQTLARGNERKEVVFKGGNGKRAQKYLPPEQWRREFEEAWTHWVPPRSEDAR